MNGKSFLSRTTGLAFILLFVSACGTSQPAPSATPVPPTAIAVPATMTITFEGSNCVYEGPQSVPAGKITIDWAVNQKEHDIYGLAVVTLTEGKGFEELNQWPSSDPPPWLNIVNLWETASGSRQQVTAQVKNGPLFFVCFYSPPDTKYGTLGPVIVLGAEPTLEPLPTITSHAAPAVTANPRPVIIDTDMGNDDWMAILYLLKRTDIID